MGLRLLDVVKHTLRMRVAHNTSKVRRSIVGHPCPQNNSFRVLLLEQPEHLLQREGAADVRIQHEEAVRPSLQYRIPEVVQAASGSQGLVLAEVLDRDVRVGAVGVLDEVAEDGLVVVADDEDLADLGDLGDGGEAVLDYRVAGDFEEGLK